MWPRFQLCPTISFCTLPERSPSLSTLYFSQCNLAGAFANVSLAAGPQPPFCHREDLAAAGRSCRAARQRARARRRRARVDALRSRRGARPGPLRGGGGWRGVARNLERGVGVLNGSCVPGEMAARCARALMAAAQSRRVGSQWQCAREIEYNGLHQPIHQHECNRMCSARWLEREKVLPHVEHSYGRSPLCREGLATRRALVRPLPAMYPHVHSQLARRREGLAARRALGATW
jgi:hypothetical protein